MHSDLAKEIAYSGEFFVRPLKESKSEEQKGGTKDDSKEQPNGTASAPQTTDQLPPSRNPKDYELIIDNDSGTYRPKKELLPVLEKWLSDQRRLGGLGNVRAMDGFDEELKKMKDERAKEKAELTGVGKKDKENGKTGKMVPVRKGTSISSISSGQIGRESVSSKEVEGALKQMENPDGKGKEKEKEQA